MHIAMKTEVVGKIQPQGTGNVEKVWVEFLKSHWEVIGKVWQDLQVADDGV